MRPTKRLISSDPQDRYEPSVVGHVNAGAPGVAYADFVGRHGRQTPPRVVRLAHDWRRQHVSPRLCRSRATDGVIAVRAVRAEGKSALAVVHAPSCTTSSGMFKEIASLFR